MKLKSVISVFIACIVIINVGYFTTASRDDVNSPRFERIQQKWPINYNDDATDLGSVVEIIDEYSVYPTTFPPINEEPTTKTTKKENEISTQKYNKLEEHFHVMENDEKIELSSSSKKINGNLEVLSNPDDDKFYSTLFDDDILSGKIHPIKFLEDSIELTTVKNNEISETTTKNIIELKNMTTSTQDVDQTTKKHETYKKPTTDFLSTIPPTKNNEITTTILETSSNSPKTTIFLKEIIVGAKKKIVKSKPNKAGFNSNLLHKNEEKLLKEENKLQKFGGKPLWKLSWKPFGKLDVYNKKQSRAKFLETENYMNNVLKDKHFQYKEFPKLLANNIFG